jgi:hypothetical protein
MAAKVGEELMSCLVGEIDAAKAAQATAAPTNSLLTTGEVLALRPGMTRRWLYENAAACGAMRKNPSQKSPLWFRLADVDAELERKRKKPVKQPPPAPRPPRRRQAKLRAAAVKLAANGATSPFVIRPRPARAGA